MHEFGISLRLWIMVCIDYRVKQSIWKDFRSMEPDLESFRLWLENWIRIFKKRR